MKKITLLLVILLSFYTGLSQSEKEKVQATVNKNKIEGHIYFLTDDLLMGRATGTNENKIAASYLANTLRSYGVKPNPQTGTYYQEVTLQKITPARNVLLKINGEEYKYKVVLKAAKIDFTGQGVYVGYGLKDDYKDQNVMEKFVIIKAGSPDDLSIRAAFRLRKQKEKLALKKGAIGIIELIKTDVKTWSFIEHNFMNDRMEIAYPEKKSDKKIHFAYLWLNDEYGSFALNLESKRSVNLKLLLEGEKKVSVISQNVIGIVEGTDPVLKNEYIIYSAHYDHIGIGNPDESGDTIYNGARDNAIGTTTVLSMAENIAKYPTKRSALFILFTGEEKGLLGSKYYVENPVIQLNQMVFCFNSDNGGYNDTSLATIIGLNRTTASQNIKDAVSTFGLIAIDDPAPEQGLFDRSDNVNFAKKGIPAPTFSLGFSSFDGDVTKYYHKPGDEADTLDYDYLLKFFSAYVLSGRIIANDSNTPFWTEGDKYEIDGKKLYNK